jgi:hypothetical protein
MRAMQRAVVAALLLVVTGGQADAACPTAFTERLDARGRPYCVATDRLRSQELLEQQELQIKALRDSQAKRAFDQRALSHEFRREQMNRAWSLRTEQRRRRLEGIR